MEIQGCRDGGIHKWIDTGIVEESEIVVGWHVRKAVDSRSSAVVRGCTQLSCLCTLLKTCFYWVRLKAQSTIHWHTSMLAYMHAHTHAQTNKQTDWEGGNSIHPTVWLRHYPHSKPDTQYFSLCCDNSVPVSAFCEQNCWQTTKTTKKYTAPRTWFWKIKWIFQTCPCFMIFWLRLFSLLLPQGLPGLPGGVGQPGLVGEKVRISH